MTDLGLADGATTLMLRVEAELVQVNLPQLQACNESHLLVVDLDCLYLHMGHGPLHEPRPVRLRHELLLVDQVHQVSVDKVCLQTFVEQLLLNLHLIRL